MDIVVLTVIDGDLKVLLIRRGAPPFEGSWALPGGFVRVSDDAWQGESLDEAAHRELCEETGLPQGSAFLEQLGAFGEPRRDPRTRVITVVYYALVRPELCALIRAGTDAAEASWESLARRHAMELAFDHDVILDKCIERVRERVDSSPLAFELVPPVFTAAELRSVYEAIKGTTYDRQDFRRRFARMETDGVIQLAPGKRHRGSKPALVYRFVRRGQRRP